MDGRSMERHDVWDLVKITYHVCNSNNNSGGKDDGYMK